MMILRLRKSSVLVIFVGLLNIHVGNSMQYYESFFKDPIQYPGDWEKYLTRIDNKDAIILLDLCLYDTAPINTQPNLLRISIIMNNPGPNGTSSTGEAKILRKLEYNIYTTMKEKYEITFAGSLTTDGKRMLYYYLEDVPYFDSLLTQAMVPYPNYTYDYEYRQDRDWEKYIAILYPSSKEIQGILNRRVSDLLKIRGDNLIEERPVTHFIYFKTLEDRDAFWDSIKNQGYEIDDMGFNESYDEYPYSIIISRMDKVDYNSIDVTVIYLWRLSLEHNGKYDGWETTLEKQ